MYQPGPAAPYKPIQQWKGVGSDGSDNKEEVDYLAEKKRTLKLESEMAYKAVMHEKNGSMAHQLLGSRSEMVRPKAEWTGMSHSDPNYERELLQEAQAKAERDAILFANKRQYAMRPAVTFDPPYEIDSAATANIATFTNGVMARPAPAEWRSGKKMIVSRGLARAPWIGEENPPFAPAEPRPSSRMSSYGASIMEADLPGQARRSSLTALPPGTVELQGAQEYVKFDPLWRVHNGQAQGGTGTNAKFNHNQSTAFDFLEPGGLALRPSKRQFADNRVRKSSDLFNRETNAPLSASTGRRSAPSGQR